MEVIDTKGNSAKKNMQIDQDLLSSLEEKPILHFYDWKRPSITHGYFIQPEKWLYLDKLEELGIDIARRPTGGGIVFHLWDLAFSFLMPSSHPNFSKYALDNYKFVNDIVLKSVQEFKTVSKPLTLIDKDKEAKFAFSSKFCMARPTKYDLMLEGKKIAGAAQRKKTQGYLHQGTISIAPPDVEILKVTLKDPLIYQEMLENTSFLINNAIDLEASRKILKQKLAEQFSQIFDQENSLIHFYSK